MHSPGRQRPAFFIIFVDLTNLIESVMGKKSKIADAPLHPFWRARVLNSKQRPRKLKVIGTDGQEYQYLLKAHEDLRLVRPRKRKKKT